MYQIPAEFQEFIKLDCDRKSFIQNYLNRSGLEVPVISLEGKNHLYVKFPLNQYNPMFKIKTVIAHYDRVENSPGANDNSAAVFCLMEWASKLARSGLVHNIRLVFTDGEELGSEGVSSQGAFALAAIFRRLGLLNDDVFVFDCMGSGNIPVLTETHLPSGAAASFKKRFFELEQRAEKILKTSSDGKWFRLPCNYSDNAGFIANGIPAVAVTMLSSEDVSLSLKGKMPETWKRLHTMEDNLEHLDSSAFEKFHEILNNLASLKTVNRKI